MKATVTNTAGMTHLVTNARGRNRSVHEDQLFAAIDPDGVHVLGMSFPHNDVEMRTQWFVKLKEAKEPTQIWLDVDFGALDEWSEEIEVNDESR